MNRLELLLSARELRRLADELDAERKRVPLGSKTERALSDASITLHQLAAEREKKCA